MSCQMYEQALLCDVQVQSFRCCYHTFTPFYLLSDSNFCQCYTCVMIYTTFLNDTVHILVLLAVMSKGIEGSLLYNNSRCSRASSQQTYSHDGLAWCATVGLSDSADPANDTCMVRRPKKIICCYPRYSYLSHESLEWKLQWQGRTTSTQGRKIWRM